MIYLSLGSNVGDRFEFLRLALKRLKSIGFTIKQESITIETKAILLENSLANWDMPYLNMVIGGNFDSSPSDLLEKLKDIECSLGRVVMHERWAPRTIDIDILLWHNEVVNIPTLTIPHKELYNRHFFIYLLATLYPQYCCIDSNSQYFSKTLDQIVHNNIDISNVFINSFSLYPRLMGILNVTPDSFSDGGKYLNPQLAMEKATQMLEQGVSVIDIGAQSTRPGSEMVGAKEELERLIPVLDGLVQYKQNFRDFKLSIDSFVPEVIEYIIDNYKVDFINLQKLTLGDSILSKIANNGQKIIIMHSISLPPVRNEVIDYKLDVSNIIENWIKVTTEKLFICGFKQEQIIIDVGICFGKTINQNLQLLRNVKSIKKLGYKLLIGHSRKSFLNCVTSYPSNQRDIETIAFSDVLSANEVDYLRVHNIHDHQRFFTAKKIINNYCNYQ